ncbi:MAG TPA: lysylphosphatidylglycerol synthase transmembrane domain-containing protein [Nannocystaceae bacterium]|nr:lysylphosphatidylglycerol synthase transmembrane domain-containing protein [Nannocystaceae bacterium]
MRPEPDAPPMWRTLLRLALGLALFGAVIAVLVDAGGRPQLRVVAWAWGVGLLGSALANAVTARRWQLLSEAMTAARLPYGAYFHHLAWTRVVGQFLPSLLVDLVGRSASLRAAGSRESMTRLLVPLVLERILDLVLPIVLLGWAIAWHVAQPRDAIAWGSVVVTLAIFGALAVPLLGPLARTAMRAYAWLRRRRGGEEVAVPQIDRALASRVSALSIARHVFVLVQYWGAGAGLGVALPLLVLVAGAPLAQLAGLVGITPGALGIQEGGWAGALGLLGVAAADIAVFVLATRAAMIVNFAVLAAASWRWHRSRA